MDREPLAVDTFTITIGEKDGRTIKPLNGVNAGPLPSGDLANVDLIGEYRSLGIKQVRTHDFYGPFDMAEIYPDRTKNPEDSASFYLANSDKYFAGIIAAGSEVYFRLGDSYNNVTPPDSSQLDHWITAGINVISHYTNGQWNGYNSRIEYVEIWNEPDYDHFWPNRSLLQFFLLFDRTAKAIKARFPDIKVGGPGFTQHATSIEINNNLRDFFDFVKNNNTPLDFISVHQYTNEPAAVSTALNNLHLVMNEKGFGEIDVHLTEWNTDEKNAANPEEVIALRVNAKGAAINTAKWIAMQNSGVDMAFFFRGNDTSMNLTTFYGMFKADGTPKKIGLAFGFFNYMANYPQRLSIANSISDSNLHIIAGENSVTGRKALIVSNISGDSFYYMTNLDTNILRILQVSDQQDSTQNIYLSNGVITMPPYGVHYLEFGNPNAVTTLIIHYYQSILDRAPDATGLDYWRQMIAERQAQELDVKPVFRDMANFFFNSQEYLNKNATDPQFIDDLYQTFFQRNPDSNGLSFWLNQLSSGVSRNQVMSGFLYSQEFTIFMESLGF